jgi:hypothetical protein
MTVQILADEKILPKKESIQKEQMYIQSNEKIWIKSQTNNLISFRLSFTFKAIK